MIGPSPWRAAFRGGALSHPFDDSEGFAMCNAVNRSTLIAHRSTSDGASDRPFLAALAHGDQQAFWTLWLLHEDRLFAVCMREMNGNRADAEDALGQAMLRGHQKLPRFASGVSSVASWLAQVTRNVCRDIQRARARRTLAEQQLAHHCREQWRRLVDVAGNDDLTTKVSEWDGDPSSLIARLPDRLRSVFILRVVQDRSYEEVAERLSVTCMTARKRIQQARAALRKWRDERPSPALRNTVRLPDTRRTSIEHENPRTRTGRPHRPAPDAGGTLARIARQS